MTDFFNNKVVAITVVSEGIATAIVDAPIPLGAKVAPGGRTREKFID